MKDLSHLDALQARLGREKARLAAAQAARPSRKLANEIAFRQREIGYCEKEIAQEYEFLGIAPLTQDELAISDDELLAELSA